MPHVKEKQRLENTWKASTVSKNENKNHDESTRCHALGHSSEKELALITLVVSAVQEWPTNWEFRVWVLGTWKDKGKIKAAKVSWNPL